MLNSKCQIQDFFKNSFINFSEMSLSNSHLPISGLHVLPHVHVQPGNQTDKTLKQFNKTQF